MKHKHVKYAIINKKKVNDMQNSNNLDKFISEVSEENKKQPLHGIRKKPI